MKVSCSTSAESPPYITSDVMQPSECARVSARLCVQLLLLVPIHTAENENLVPYSRIQITSF